MKAVARSYSIFTEYPLTILITVTWFTPKRRTFPRDTLSHLLHNISQQPKMATLYKESQIILAIQAIRQDKNLSRRKAAAIYNVPEATLRYRMNGRAPKSESRPAAHRLTITEEEAVVQYVLDLDMRGFAPQYAGVEDIANLLLAKRNGRRVGKH